ncbi:MAG: superoxide dismutase [Oscillospiraceae bacterium]
MENKYPFTLEKFPFGYADLEPYIDEKTVDTHINKHLAGYIKSLNELLAKLPCYQNFTLEELICHKSLFPQELGNKIAFNAGGILNHNFYFNMLTAKRLSPDGLLLAAIEKSFCSLEDFKAELKKAAANRFGSGYIWVISDWRGFLKIVTTANQEVEFSCEKIFTIDVWEHAYYLKYLNKRADYVENIFNVIDWDKAEKRYKAALKVTLQ